MKLRSLLAKQSLLTNLSIYVFLGFLPLGVNLLLVPQLTSKLSKEEYALFSLINLFQAYTTIFVTLGLPAGFNSFFFKKGGLYGISNSKLLLLTVFLVLVNFSGIMVVLEFLGQNCIDLMWKSHVLKYNINGRYAVIISCFISISGVFLGYYRNMKNPKNYALFAICSTVSVFIFSELALIHYVDVQQLMILKTIGTVLPVIVFIMLFIFKEKLSYVSINLYFLIKLSKRLFWISLPFVPFSLLELIFSTLDKWSLERWGTLSSFALFSLSTQIAGVGFIFITSLFNSLFPTLMENYLIDFEKLKRGFFTYRVAVIVFVLVCNAALPFALKIFIKKDFFEIVTFSSIYFLSFIAHAYYQTAAIPLTHSQKNHIFPIVSLFTLILGIALVFSMAFILKEITPLIVSFLFLAIKIVQYILLSFFVYKLGLKTPKLEPIKHFAFPLFLMTVVIFLNFFITEQNVFYLNLIPVGILACLLFLFRKNIFNEILLEL